MMSYRAPRLSCGIPCPAGDFQGKSAGRGILTHDLPLCFPPLYFPPLCFPPLCFPGADRFHRSSRTDWFLAFLEMFPSPHMISAMTKEDFIKAAWEVVGRKVEKSLMLSDIYETAKASAGLPVAPDSDAIRVRRGNDPPDHCQNPPHFA